MASAEAVVRRCSARKGVSQILQENTGVFFNKKYNFIKKETPPQVFSCEFCKKILTTLIL